jgi:hypothetical protein
MIYVYNGVLIVYLLFLDAALLQYTQVSALPDAENMNVQALRTWITRPDCGNYCIGGAGSGAWGSLYEPKADPKSFWQVCKTLLRGIFGWKRLDLPKFDLVATHPQQKVDALTHWIFQEWLPFYYAIRNLRSGVRARDEEEPTMERVDEVSSVTFNVSFQ